MSSQILVYGYVELVKGTEPENSRRLAEIRAKETSPGFGFASSFGPPLPGWPSSTVSFARSYKRTSPEDHETLQSEFEDLLRTLSAISGHLSIEDQEGIGERHIDYSYGPTKYGGQDVWTRVVFERVSGKSESF